ncbi:MAG: hypothetical protein WCI67_08200 [Chloroflexales bacterium]
MQIITVGKKKGGVGKATTTEGLGELAETVKRARRRYSPACRRRASASPRG